MNNITDYYWKCDDCSSYFYWNLCGYEDNNNPIYNINEVISSSYHKCNCGSWYSDLGMQNCTKHKKTRQFELLFKENNENIDK